MEDKMNEVTKYAGKLVTFLTADSVGLFCALTSHASNGADGLAKLAKHPGEFAISEVASKATRKSSRKITRNVYESPDEMREDGYWGEQGG